MKTTIDLEDLKGFVNSLDSSSRKNWCGPVNYMSGDYIVDFLEWNGNTEIAKEFRSFLEEGLENDQWLN